MIINTHGTWNKFETVAKMEFEIGKTYRISVEGTCEFGIGAKEPKTGINSNKIEFKANDKEFLWIKTK